MVMILYVDETENEEFFIVAGLLVQSEKDVKIAYKQLKNSISNYSLSKHAKERVFLEFKSTLIDPRFQRIKRRLLKTVSSLNGSILYSCYIKKHGMLKQLQKESVYLTLLSRIVNSVEEQLVIIFDRFNKQDFERKIIHTIMEHKNVSSIESRDSQLEPGLQFADNVCSTLRLYLSGEDKNHYYSIIETIVHKV